MIHQDMLTSFPPCLIQNRFFNLAKSINDAVSSPGILYRQNIQDTVYIDKEYIDKVCIDKVCMDKVCMDKVYIDKVCIDQICIGDSSFLEMKNIIKSLAFQRQCLIRS